MDDTIDLKIAHAEPLGYWNIYFIASFIQMLSMVAFGTIRWFALVGYQINNVFPFYWWDGAVCTVNVAFSITVFVMYFRCRYTVGDGVQVYKSGFYGQATAFSGLCTTVAIVGLMLTVIQDQKTGNRLQPSDFTTVNGVACDTTCQFYNSAVASGRWTSFLVGGLIATVPIAYGFIKVAVVNTNREVTNTFVALVASGQLHHPTSSRIKNTGGGTITHRYNTVPSYAD